MSDFDRILVHFENIYYTCAQIVFEGRKAKKMRRSALDIKCTSPLPRRGAEAFQSNTWLPKEPLVWRTICKTYTKGSVAFYTPWRSQRVTPRKIHSKFILISRIHGNSLF